MIKVRQLRVVSEDRPAQWEGLAGDEGSVFIRYRWGELEVYFSETSRDPVGGGVRVFEKRIGGKYDGQLSTERMKSELYGICKFGG